MRCDEFELALQQCLDGDANSVDEAAIRCHALSCATCRELEDGFRLIAHGFVVSRPPQPSGHLTARILASLERELTPQRWWLKPAIAFAAAASLFIALAWRILPRTPATQNQPLAVASNDRSPDERRPLASSSVGLTSKLHSSLEDEPLFPDNDSRDQAILSDAVEPVSQIVRAVGRSLGSPVRPIAVGATEVIGNFFKDLPDSDSTMLPLPGMPQMKSAPKRMPQMRPPS